MRATPLFSLRSLTPAIWMLSLAACSSSAPSGEVIDGIRGLTEFKNGIATWYDATGAGHCGYDKSPNDMDVAAMNAPEFNNSAVCGSCAEVEGPQGTVRVRIVDSCPECAAGHLDLSKQAFAKISPVEAGRVSTRWRMVSCAVEGPVRYRIKEGSNPHWAAIQVRNHLLPIQKLEWQKNGSWVEAKRENYNYFVEASGMGSGSVRIRITATDGQQLEDTLPQIEANQIFNGAKQFSLQ
ncbi:expansin EXLX1 family cellulose-binding protein [Hyalangium sp.]|uniref:expansin EXLX1 family cellulose-binding protein n=1 Tax=Hyalangium sp. TaxID=2028555 RepID=UPI002D2B9145|nr:expansin EXLX1 family cellulose-binding protein [Hyalangium sp.]HYH95439.1 expansin EXLX1 family cellulose-binding protein [Hyalangium sp.]